jgi:hypothetical protein
MQGKYNIYILRKYFMTVFFKIYSHNGCPAHDDSGNNKTKQSTNST